MKSKADKGTRKQVGAGLDQAVLGTIRQFLMPMVAGMVTAKQDLLTWMQEVGVEALKEMFAADAEQLAGEKGKHRVDRTHHYWGFTTTELPFGGRRIRVERPRVKSKAGKEATLPHVRHFQQCDPVAERVLNQILLGVSTRGYGASLEPAALEPAGKTHNSECGSGRSPVGGALGR